MVDFLKGKKIFELLMLLKKGYGFYKWQIFALAVLSLFGGFMEGIGINAVIPLFSFLTGRGGEATDTISNLIKSVFDFLNITFSLRYLLVFIFVLFAIRAIVLISNNYIKIKISTDYSETMRNRLFGRVIRADWPHLLKQKLGYLDTLLLTNIGNSETLLSKSSTAVTTLFGLVTYLFVAINISLPVTIMTIVLGGIIFFSFKPLLDQTRRLSSKVETLNRDIAHFVNENVLGLKTVKAMLADSPVVSKGMQLFKELRNLRFKVLFLSIIPDSLLPPIGLIFVLAIFAFSYKSPNFNLAALAAIVYLIDKIFIYVQQLQSLFQSIYENLPYLRSLLAYEDQALLNVEDGGGLGRFSFNKSLEFKEVVFSYVPGKEVFNKINFSVKQGEMLGIIGHSGVGKTTITDLILRLFKPTAGAILLDGIDISTINLKSWRSSTGYVSQDIFLLNDTISNNIRFYDKSISDEEVEKASRMANLYDFIQTLPNKFQTAIGERGIMLSGGQRQRIVIARVLAREPKLLLLDEATSALDNESEKEIQAVIDNLKGRVTVLVIAHRLTTVLNADKLIVLSDGKVSEEGSPKDLLADKNSYFYNLYNLKR